MSLSVAIITKNEEQNLARTLRSVAWANELVVVDSGSTDRTCEIAREYGARVILQDWLGFGAQKNFALAQCSGDWLLSLDADEEVSPELHASIEQAIAGGSDSVGAPAFRPGNTGTQDRGALAPGTSPPQRAKLGKSANPPAIQAYRLPRRNYFLGRPLRNGGMYPDSKLRLLRRELFTSGAARFAERPVHEDIVYAGPAATLTGDLLHHAYPTLEQFFEHMNRYSTLGAEQILHRGKPEGAWWFLRNVVLNPWATFAYNYALRGGFLDGQEGLMYHAYHSCYVSLKYSKAWQAAHAPHDCC